MFISLEYEWDYLSNTAYVDGFVNSAMVGVGVNLLNKNYHGKERQFQKKRIRKRSIVRSKIEDD